MNCGSHSGSGWRLWKWEGHTFEIFYAASLELSGLVYRGQKELTSAGELVESIQCCSQADDDCRFRPHGLVH